MIPVSINKELTLTIAIPTYNRASKLLRVLDNICLQIGQSAKLLSQVSVVVSDNASSDETPSVLAGYDPNGVRFQFYRQPRNLGLDGNMRFLYTRSQTDYVWFFSDDDLVFPGAVERILTQLEINKPEAVLFSFVQPPGSTLRTFDFPNPVEIVSNPVQIIRLLAHCPKLSIYVLKRVEITNSEQDILEDFFGTDYFFIALAYTVIQRPMSPKICVISEPLAGCDRDFNVVRFRPETWGRSWVVFKHPYVTTNAPGLGKSGQRAAYYEQIQALFAVKTGNLIATEPILYDEFISRMEIHPLWLCMRPRSLVQLLFLKAHLAEDWPKLKRKLCCLKSLF